MGFSNTLKRNAVNEWKDYYLEYEKLKDRIKNRDFKALLYSEVTKINNFYFLLEKKAVDDKDYIFNVLMPGANKGSVLENKGFSQTTDDENEPKDKKKGTSFEDLGDIDFNSSTITLENTINEPDNTFTSIKGLASFIPLKSEISNRKKEKYITEFLHSLIKIKAYRDLNSTGLLKLAKRYSQIYSNQIFYEKFSEKLKETYFVKSKRIDLIRNAVKKMYKKIFAKGQPEKAKSVFRRVSKGTDSFDIYYILSGFFTGISFTLSLTSYLSKTELSKLSIGINLFYMGFILFGLCLKFLKNFSVNYKFIFNFDVASSMNNSVYLFMVSSLTLCTNLILKYGISFINFSVVSLLALSIPIIFLVSPIDYCCLNSRVYLISALGRGLLLPISTIRFRHFYFVDVLQSFSYPIEQILSSFIKEANKAKIISLYVVCFFPFIRVMQCLKRFANSRLFSPHILNSFKYALVISFVVLRIIKLNYLDNIEYQKNIDTAIHLVRLSSTTASFLWDIGIDWAMFRNRYMYPGWIYLLAFIFNISVRFSWLLDKYWFSQIQNFDKNAFELVIGVCEIIRRFVWTAIRVEVEHLNNCNELKIKKAINLTSGELFYKKDVHDSVKVQEKVLVTETEFETEIEEEKEPERKVLETPNQELFATEDDSIIEYEESSETLKSAKFASKDQSISD